MITQVIHAALHAKKCSQLIDYSSSFEENTSDESQCGHLSSVERSNGFIANTARQVGQAANISFG